jgi:23S rRNA (adenine2503-C2)-methyltransferase
MISIIANTQSSYADEIFARVGKGRQHAAGLYRHWHKTGSLEMAAEPQAEALMSLIRELTGTALPPISRCIEEGGVVKFLLRFHDGLESESVLIPMASGTTLCLSSQIGCKMGCAFCETGKMGLIRSLTAEEIVAQLLVATFQLKKKVRNLVFMGMGEPFDNYEAVMEAIDIFTDPAGIGLGKRRITLSTSGRVDGILRMARVADPALNLAVSVNAPTDAIRKKLMPVNKEWDMSALKEAMQIYCSSKRTLLIEYVLIQGINDSIECAEALGEYLSGLPVKINLIPYNTQTRGRFAPPDLPTQNHFKQRMRALGYPTLLRGTKGDQIKAACGQLGNIIKKFNLSNE